MQCTIGGVRPTGVGNIATVEFRDDGRYEITCPKGHTSITILQQQKFELLFDIGAFAITDGYYREAVSSFTSSLERFYEFFIKAVLFEKATDEAAVVNSWKAIARQSERQLGAFIILYTSEFGRSPTLLGERQVQFRNEVIHRGKIPSAQEALAYGQVVLDLIRPLLREAKERYPKGVNKTVFDHMAQGRQSPTERSGTMSIPTIVSLNIADETWDKRSLEQAIKELRRWG